MSTNQTAQVVPSKEVEEVYAYFHAQSGSEHIANLDAIQTVLDIIAELKPSRVVEMGGGLGTFSYAILKFTSAPLTVYEDESFCLGRLKENLSGYSYELITSYDNLPKDPFELLIVDGGTARATRDLVHAAENLKCVFIEGKRRIQRRVVLNSLRAAGYTQRFQVIRDRRGNLKSGRIFWCKRSSNPIAVWLSYFSVVMINLTWEVRLALSVKKAALRRAFRP